VNHAISLGGVVVPGSADVGVVTVGGGVAVAEGLGDDGSGGLEDEIAESGGAGFGDGDAELTQGGQERAGGEGLAGAAAGEQPPGQRPRARSASCRQPQQTCPSGQRVGAGP
jgi:hypothetical protein